MNNILKLAAVTATATLLVACSGQPKATAKLGPTSGNIANGTVTLVQKRDGVELDISLAGLTPGAHGFHVHANGDCSSGDGKSAGGHYNPTGAAHGAPDAANRHIGDLGNVTADAQGNVSVKQFDKALSLSGENSIIGKAFIVHGGTDDLSSQPSGAAGPRVACGVITAAK